MFSRGQRRSQEEQKLENFEMFGSRTKNCWLTVLIQYGLTIGLYTYNAQAAPPSSNALSRQQNVESSGNTTHSTNTNL